MSDTEAKEIQWTIHQTHPERVQESAQNYRKLLTLKLE